MKAPLPIEPTLYEATRLPFANEDELQRFIEEHTEPIFGLKVVASSNRGGELFEIDILAVNAANTPFIIECKWDRVGDGAIRQLVGYQKKLLDNWPLFLERVSKTRGRRVAVKRREPVLIAIGYRYVPSVLSDAPSVVCLTYAYHPATLTIDALEQQRPGHVSVQHAHEMLLRQPGHPRVSKRYQTLERLAPLPPTLQTGFLETDGRLRALDAVTVVHGKDFVRYRVPRGEFAEAKIGPKSIRWRYGQRGAWLVECDADKIFDLLRQAHMDAG